MKEEDLRDEDTAELEALGLAPPGPLGYDDPGAAAIQSSARASATQSSLEHMEAELERLRLGWSGVQAELDEKSARIAELERALEAERDERDGQIVALRAELGERDELMAELTSEANRRAETITRQRERIAELEVELEQRERTVNLLDRKLERLSILGTRLQKLDRDNGDGFEYPFLGLEESGRFAGAVQPDDVSPESSHDGAAPARASLARGSPKAGRSARRVFVMHDGQSDTSFLICKQQMTIGRSQRSDIRVNGDFVSRIHARVFAHSIGTVIEDADSTNGLLVNSEPVTRCMLKDGDIVSLAGRLDLKYVELNERPDPG